MSEQFKGFVFARPSSPEVQGQEFGHVGWGFQISNNRYMVGAVENYGGKPVAPASESGFWAAETAYPLNKHALGPRDLGSRYDIYKELPVSSPNLHAALEMQEWVSRQPYKVLGQNCMDATAQILQAYGVKGLPDTSSMENYFPINWFRHLGSPLKVLTKTDVMLDVAFYEHPEFEGKVWRLYSDQSGLQFSGLGDWSRRISSVVVRSGEVTLYLGAGFNHASVTLKQSYAFLGGWTRLAESVVATASKSRPRTSASMAQPKHLRTTV
jgi:hypothetical protein